MPMPPEKLTERQREVLAFIQQQIATGLPPTRMEIARYFGFTGNASECHIQALARKGFISTLGDARSRGIVLVRPCDSFDDRNVWDQFSRVVFLMKCNGHK